MNASFVLTGKNISAIKLLKISIQGILLTKALIDSILDYCVLLDRQNAFSNS